MKPLTTIPRWTCDPRPGIAEYHTTIPEDLLVALTKLANEWDVPLGSVLLTAHAKVLAASSSEQDVVTGYVPVGANQPIRCRLSTEPNSWRGLLLRTRRAELEPEPRDTELSYEVELDLTGSGRALSDGTVLRVEITQDEGRLVVRLRYRTDVIDADCATRIAGYHRTALALIVADPGADHGRQSLLSDQELHHQLERLAGPRRKLPDLRFHELFEERVRAHPDSVAAIQGDRRWTYQQLNARANRLGRALLARGLRREGVVAVVAERTLDWMAAVLAVFKAGGSYLPIEPTFPAERIATMLSRAECRLVLAEEGSTTTLQRALDSLSGNGISPPELISLTPSYEAEHADGDLGVPVTSDQLAYIYFTSGSTGTPKGAMCEHAGMLNHLYAKLDDLRISEGQVVAQTAPQCFDISLWQLVSALLVGGRTLLIEQDVILDVRTFVDTLVAGQVTVLQAVPSYLDVVLSYLEQHPRELPDLRYVSVTGEPLKRELAQRWFATQPETRLVNAYGLTETSDDTNHDVMDRTPDRVLLGRPVNNVYAYVVDEHLSPVPLGAPGAIVFSGVCVGRGYVNDPERTRLAFVADPYRPGQRLYLSGDYGRWRPDGKLEFLGRRDSQVKISGFRIEVGEVENALAQLPGIRDCAVVVTEPAGRSKQLVAFYTSRQPLHIDALRERLGASLPRYMVPTTFCRRENLPLTANGKVDKNTLTMLAAELDAAGAEHDLPHTRAEHQLADAWSQVLGIPRDRIGRRDQFFELGGTSLSAVRLVIALDRKVSLQDLTRHPVLADLARLIDNHRRERP